MKRIIASFDGGGERGILQALQVAKIEQVTGKPARETFSMVAGTSTGALIASAIAAGLPAEKMVNIYRHRLGDIFNPRPPLSQIKQAAHGHKYEIRNLRNVLDQEFGDKAGWKLDDSPIDILLTAVNLADSKPWYFVKGGITGGLSLLDCASASAAAPTYFDPFPMGPPINARVVDGGVGVTGNPVYQAAVEAFEYNHYDPGDTIIVSFGTGENPVQQANPKSILDWLKWLADDLLAGPETLATQLVTRHYSKATFYRLNPLLPSAVEMDDVSRIGELDRAGQAFTATVDFAPIIAGLDSPFKLAASPSAPTP